MTEVDRPEPGQELNEGPPAEPREAASVIVLRGGDEALEVLLTQRNPEARFMGGAWVFPGGSVDPGEELIDTAVRETREEVGIECGPEGLVPFSRWITPKMVKIRFDTWFFLAPVPDGAEPTIDGEEVVDWRWLTPADALALGEAGELLLVFPTIKHLEQLGAFATASELLDYATGREVGPVEPRVILEGEVARILLPGEPGYDDA